MDLIDKLHEQYVIPVIRELELETILAMANALIAGGMKVIEITLMSAAAYQAIYELSQNSKLIIGAGTVLSVEAVKGSMARGAKFLVSPAFNPEIVAFAHANNTLFIPGVLSPTEIVAAQQANCELLKIYPIGLMGGPNYIQLLRGPFPHLKCLASGGVTVELIPNYFSAGATCIGLGGHTMKAEHYRNDWQQLTELAVAALAVIKKARRV